MAEVFDKYGLDLSDFDSGLGKIIGGYDEINQKTKQLAQQNPFKGQADDVLKYNNQLRAGAALFGKLESGPKGVKAEIQRLSAELITLVANQNKATNPKTWKQTQDEIKKAKDRLAELGAQLDDVPAKTNPIAGGFGKIGDAIKGAFAATGILFLIDKVVEFGKELIGVTGIGEKYQGQFTRIFEGNQEAAKGYLSSLQKVADTTNLTFEQLTDNSAKLASRGIIASREELLKLGDAANFINKDFTQLTESVLDANNSERWKELGFTVKTQGDKMTLAYGDFTKTVDNSVKGAYEAIQAFSEQGKVLGSTAEAGQQLSGKMSTLTDGVAGFFRTIGQGNSGVLHFFIDLLTKVVGVATDLVKSLQPVANTIGDAFGAIGKTIGGVFTSFSNFDTQAEKTATITQKLGYYLQTYLILPLAEFTLIVAGVIEGFNQIIIAGELVAAKLSGDKSLSATLSRQLDESKKRYAEIREEFLKDKKLRSEGLDSYVNRDNQRQRREDRRNRLNEEALANFKPTVTNTPKPTDEKAAQKAAKEADKEREDILKSKKQLEADLGKLQDEADKMRLEKLSKNSAEYLALKQKLDLKEIDQEEQKQILEGQQLTGYWVKDLKTGDRKKVDNKAYQLPKSTQDYYNTKRQAVNTGADTDFYNQQEADALVQAEQTQAYKLEEAHRKSNELLLELDTKLNDAEEQLKRQAGESEIDYERRKQKALLDIRLEYAQKQYNLIKNDPTQKAQAEALRKTILEAQASIAGIKKEGKAGPQNIFEFLGISYKDKDGNDITDQIAARVGSATSAVINNANEILSQQLSADQERISSIDQQIAAKQNEVQTETELAKAGLANNLALKQQEAAALQREREKAVAAQRRDQAIQLGINATIQASELALAAAKIFRGYAGLPVVGQIAAIVEIAAMFIAFGATVSRISSLSGSLPKYHDGDEVTTETARQRSVSGNRQLDEVDARLQIGEGVTRKQAYQPNKKLFSRLNTLDRALRSSDMAWLVDGTGVELPEAVKQGDLLLINQLNEARQQGPDTALHKRVDELNGHVQTLIAETRRGNTTSRQQLPDGRIREVDERGNVTVYTHT